ncbi:MAG: hypothetical protein AB1641_17115 [Thermodesulfobacteriota bacterium]
MKALARISLALFCLGIGFCLAACSVPASKVALSAFTPKLKGEYKEYRGKRIHLLEVANEASNTNVWGYYSQDRRVAYVAWPNIHSFFWYAFERALVLAGLDVVPPERKAPVLPDVQFVMKSVSDADFEFDVRVMKRGASIFKKRYSVTEPPLPRDQRSESKLKDRANRMATKVVEKVLDDEDFEEALKKASERPK